MSNHSRTASCEIRQGEQEDCKLVPWCEVFDRNFGYTFGGLDKLAEAEICHVAGISWGKSELLGSARLAWRRRIDSGLLAKGKIAHRTYL